MKSLEQRLRASARAVALRGSWPLAGVAIRFLSLVFLLALHALHEGLFDPFSFRLPFSQKWLDGARRTVDFLTLHAFWSPKPGCTTHSLEEVRKQMPSLCQYRAAANLYGTVNKNNNIN